MPRKSKATSSNRKSVTIACQSGDGRPSEIERLERLNIAAEQALMEKGREADADLNAFVRRLDRKTKVEITPPTLDSVRTLISKMRTQLETDSNSGLQFQPAAKTTDEWLARLKDQHERATLPDLDRLWQMMHRTGLPDVRAFPGEPKTAAEAFEGLDIAEEWCDSVSSMIDIRNYIDSVRWLRRLLGGWKTLPDLDRLWCMMYRTGLPNIPKYPGEPKTARQAARRLTVAQSWIDSHF